MTEFNRLFYYLSAALFGLAVLFSSCRGRENTQNSLKSQQVTERSTDAYPYLEQSQGMTPEQKSKWYWTGQGSQTVPYAFFLNLEQAESTELFRSDKNMRHFGYIPAQASVSNPDSLPIGFVKSKIKKDNSEWLGFTCAACHTGEISASGKTLRIEGGPTMANHMLFRTELMAALEKTKVSTEKYARFSKSILGHQSDAAGQEKLKNQFDEYYTWFKRLYETGKETPAVPYGPGRLDAFSLEIIQFVVDGLGGIQENYHAPEAPVSYPQVWDSSDLEWVQWNGISKIPLERNIGEAIGVFGRINLLGNDETRFENNIDFDGLFTLEKTLRSMKSPTWPKELLGEVDTTKALAGRKLFVENCAGCHNDVDDRTPANSLGKKFIKIKMVPIAEIKTDPVFLQTLLGWTVKTGPLEGLVIGQTPEGQPIKLAAREPAAKILKTGILGIEKRFFKEFQLSKERINEFRNNVDEALPVPPNLNAYKARPLNGVWASPPFLHNGSVPNLRELLKPEGERTQVFYVGSTEFDPVNVGYDVKQSESNYFKFDTREKANSNLGHSGQYYGTDLQPEEKSAIIEYLKSI